MSTITQCDNGLRLPFVERGDKHSNWAVITTGDYERDYEEGRRFARRFVRAIQMSAVTPFILSDIVTAMPGEKGPVENGFLSGISIALLMS